MNLLPKSSKEFGSVDYWEKFFQQRGKKAFEWYGTYLELCGVLHKYIKPREKEMVTLGQSFEGSVGFKRLITVALHRGQQYESMDSIQAELSARVLELAPAGMPTQQQCRMEKSQNSSGSFLGHYHCWPGILLGSLVIETPLALLVVGLGGGSLPLFVHDHFLKSCIDAVEIDPSMLEVATQWFGFSQSDRMKVHIADGLDYITSLAGREVRPHYSVIMFDVDSKDPTLGMSCPPPAFVDQPFLQKVKSILSPEGVANTCSAGKQRSTS
ncbi:eEF1A lysine and N-terminal methyltransferase [Prionailurus iriomotensis]